MLHKAHAFPLHGGLVSYDFHSHRGQFDAFYVLFDPITEIPLTNSQLYELLQERCHDEPYLLPYVEYLLPDIQRKTARYPDSEFRLSCRGKTKDEALALLQQTHGQSLDDLTCVLFRDELKSQISAGKLTLSEFYYYARPSLFLAEPEDIRKRYQGLIQNWILPVAGEKSLEELTLEEQTRICNKVSRTLSAKNAQRETLRLVRLAYRLLLEDMQQYYKEFRYSASAISKQISIHNARNREIHSAFVPRHLDPDIRQRYFSYLDSLPDNHYLAYINALVYSGLDCSDISALPFSSLQRVDMGPSHFYKTIVDRRQYKNGKRHATRRILNADCALSCFRTVVFSEDAVSLIDQRIKYFYAKGLSNDEIRSLSLSCEFPGTSSVNFTELEQRISSVVQELGISSTSVPRVKKGVEIQMETITAGYPLIKGDALYLAQNVCRLPPPLLHTMFDAHLAETDEQAYLDLDSDELSRTHYLFTRRCFGPERPVQIDSSQHKYMTGSQPHAMRLVLRFDKAAEVTIHSDFGIIINHKEAQL